MKMFYRNKGFLSHFFPSSYLYPKVVLPRDSLELVQHRQQPKQKKFIFKNLSYLDYETLERAVGSLRRRRSMQLFMLLLRYREHSKRNKHEYPRRSSRSMRQWLYPATFYQTFTLCAFTARNNNHKNRVKEGFPNSALKIVPEQVLASSDWGGQGGQLFSWSIAPPANCLPGGQPGWPSWVSSEGWGHGGQFRS